MRSHMREIRARLSVDQEKHDKIIHRLEDMNSPIWRGFRSGFGRKITVAGFYPVGSEPNLLSLLQRMREKYDMITALPRIEEDEKNLTFRPFKSEEELIKHPSFNIKEPSVHSEIVIPNVIFVPLLAFDVDGYRLGYGGGFYDRAIAKMRSENMMLKTVGVGYEAQKMTSHLPREAHDQKLDFVMTESHLFSFQK